MGLPGAGKTTVAALAADLLGAPRFDLDQAISDYHEAPIPELFSLYGEPWFRAEERAAMERLLAGPPAVIATGGGWAAQPGNLATAEGRGLTLYMSVSPELAAARLEGVGDRPLLAGAALPRLRELLAAREAYYRRADLEIDASGAPDAVAAAVATAAKGDIPITLTSLGTVTLLATVTVKSQVSGYLTEI
ncbi:MAG TPA: shikimate kinase, partial [Gemmatimonadales bacterium]|nr:shikimate kinase [Gemmatimonadales bacterium]